MDVSVDFFYLLKSKTVQNVYVLDGTKIMLRAFRNSSHFQQLKGWFTLLEILISIIKFLQEFSNVKTKASLKLYLLVIYLKYVITNLT